MRLIKEASPACKELFFFFRGCVSEWGEFITNVKRGLVNHGLWL